MFEQIRTALSDDFKTWSERIERQRHGVVQGRLFFLHIPKCGGTSVVSAINRKFHPKSRHKLDVLAATRASEELNLDLMSYRENLLLYFMSKQDCRLVTGHYNWSDEAYRLFKEEWKFVTMLRHPVEKWLSQYHFNRFKGSTTRHFGVDMELHEYMESVEGMSLGYDQVRKLSDLAITEPEAMLDAALRNLEAFEVVGLIERLENFQQEFRQHFGTTIDVPRLNTNPARTRQQVALSTPEIYKQVEELCRHDMVLYRAALDRLGLDAK